MWNIKQLQTNRCIHRTFGTSMWEWWKQRIALSHAAQPSSIFMMFAVKRQMSCSWSHAFAVPSSTNLIGACRSPARHCRGTKEVVQQLVQVTIRNDWKKRKQTVTVAPGQQLKVGKTTKELTLLRVITTWAKNYPDIVSDIVTDISSGSTKVIYDIVRFHAFSI